MTIDPNASYKLPNLVGREVEDGRLYLLQRLGIGSFGAVYRAIDQTNGEYYAVKVIRLLGERGKQQATSAEVAAHWAVRDHPHVLSIHRVFIDHGLLMLVLDLIPGGNLLYALATDGIFWNNDALVRWAFIQIIDVLAHRHRRGVAHRDIKPENILVSADGLTFYLADFGLSTMNRRCLTSCTSSKPFQAPECIDNRVRTDGRTYDPRVADVWSLGIVLVLMVAGRCPWRLASTSDKHFADYIANPAHALRSRLPLTPICIDLVLSMLEPDPTKRVTLTALRRRVLDIDSFILSPGELAHAPARARTALQQHARALGFPLELPPVDRARETSEPQLYGTALHQPRHRK